MTLKNHGQQLQVILKREKEGYATLAEIQAAASGYNKMYNNLITQQQNDEWIKSSADPWSIAGTNPRLLGTTFNNPQPGLSKIFQDDKGANDAPAKVEDLAANPISEQTNASTDFSQAEQSALSVNNEDLKKAGKDALDGVDFNNNLVPEADGPVQVQSGVKEGFGYSMNSRAGAILTGGFRVNHALSKRNNSLFGKEGFKPRVNGV